jgi:Glycosyl hydrolase family 26
MRSCAGRPATLLFIVAIGVGLLLGVSGGPTAAATPVAPPLKDHVRFGAYTAGMTEAPARFAELEARLGGRLQVASHYYGFPALFPGAVDRHLADGGRRDVLLSWEMGPTRFRDWTQGKHDAYLREIGRRAAAHRYPVYVRPWPEMNGDWAPWQPTTAGDRPYGGTPAEFVTAWRHVVTTVRAAGGTNVRWVFNPDAATYPGTTDVRTIFPGRRYVDVLGIDGYNWGADEGWGAWRSFDEIFAEMYAILTTLHPTAPVWICEFGSKEPSYDDGAPADAAHDKGRWLTEAGNSTAFPRVAVLAYFDIKKERDWRLDSSPSALSAMRALITAPGGTGPSKRRLMTKGRPRLPGPGIPLRITVG